MNEKKLRTSTPLSISSIASIAGASKGAKFIQASGKHMTVMQSLLTFVNINAFCVVNQAITSKTRTGIRTRCVAAVVVTFVFTIVEAFIDA